MAAAKHRAIDLVRRRSLLERKHGELGRELEEKQENSVPDYVSALDNDIGDDLLRLIFTSCHPVLGTDAQLALTLRACATAIAASSQRWAKTAFCSKRT